MPAALFSLFLSPVVSSGLADHNQGLKTPPSLPSHTPIPPSPAHNVPNATPSSHLTAQPPPWPPTPGLSLHLSQSDPSAPQPDGVSLFHKHPPWFPWKPVSRCFPMIGHLLPTRSSCVPSRPSSSGDPFPSVERAWAKDGGVLAQGQQF